MVVYNGVNYPQASERDFKDALRIACLQLCLDYIDANDGSNAQERETERTFRENAIPLFRSKVDLVDGPGDVLLLAYTTCQKVLSSLDGSNAKERHLLDATRAFYSTI